MKKNKVKIRFARKKLKSRHFFDQNRTDLYRGFVEKLGSVNNLLLPTFFKFLRKGPFASFCRFPKKTPKPAKIYSF